MRFVTPIRPAPMLTLMVLAVALPSRAVAPPLANTQKDTKATPAQQPKTAPAYSVKDVESKSRTDRDYAGRGGVLFFFCGCDPCHKTARLWSQIQLGGALPVDAAGKPVSTRVFFFGEADAARGFLQETGLDPAQTTMIADAMMDVGHRYGVETCPRAFAVDAAGRIRYTNTRKDDGAQGGSVTVIVSRLVQAVRDAPKSKPDVPASVPKSAEKPLSASGLVAVPEKGDEVVSPVRVIRHLGEYDRETTPPLEQVLLLSNRGTKPFPISGVEGSCGCTDLTLYPGDRRKRGSAGASRFSESDARHSLVLQPGAAATLRVRLNVGEVEAGRHRKYAWVLQPETNAAAVTLCLDFVVRSRVTGATKRIEFGLVKAGEPRTVPFTITVDEGNLAPTRPPALLSTNPNIRVRPSGGVLSTYKDGKPVAQMSYDLTLSPRATLGNIAGSLLLAQGLRKVGRSASRKAPLVLAAFGGEVVGEVRALPGTILFGSVGMGKEHRQRATLLLANVEVQKGLKVTSSAPWLQARVADAGGQTPGSPSILGAYAHLDVVLAADAPIGPVEGTISIVTASGQKLLVPVVATVAR